MLSAPGNKANDVKKKKKIDLHKYDWIEKELRSASVMTVLISK